jgi:signal transduction histidine kinase
MTDMPRWWRRAALGGAAVVPIAAAAAAPTAGPLRTLPAAVAASGLLGVLAGWPGSSRHRLAVVAAAAGAVSLAVSVGTGVRLIGDRRAEELSADGWTLIEVAALSVLVFLVARAAPGPRWWLAAGAGGVAVPAHLLRFGLGGPSVVSLVGFTSWAVGAALVAGGGYYLRSLETRRARSVLDARRAQRLELAGDLHDFVAHDVSEMLALAQAAQLIIDDDPTRARDALGRIERAALQALASMDRTVQVLHDPDGCGPPADNNRAGPAEPAPVLADLRGLAERFAAAGPVAVHLALDPRIESPQLGGAVSREVASTAYRVVVEALTNVRRHARLARRVTVGVRVSGDPTAVTVTITDDAAAATSHRVAATRGGTHRGGVGLPALAARVEALGGTLRAGPQAAGGWQVTAVLPLRPALAPRR